MTDTDAFCTRRNAGSHHPISHHELRSPITHAKVNLALMDKREYTQLISDDH